MLKITSSDKIFKKFSILTENFINNNDSDNKTKKIVTNRISLILIKGKFKKMQEVWMDFINRPTNYR